MLRLFAAILVLLTLLPAPAVAEILPCTCMPDTFDNRWRDAQIVFAGTLRKMEQSKDYPPLDEDIPLEATFFVDDGYKGIKTGETFTLHTSLTRRTCTGHPFEPWGKYVVFAYRRKTETFEYWSLYNFPSDTFDVGGLCGGTKKLTDPAAAEDLARILDILDREEVPVQSLIDRILQREPEKKPQKQETKKP